MYEHDNGDSDKNRHHIRCGNKFKEPEMKITRCAKIDSCCFIECCCCDKECDRCDVCCHCEKDCCNCGKDCCHGKKDRDKCVEFFCIPCSCPYPPYPCYPKYPEYPDYPDYPGYPNKPGKDKDDKGCREDCRD